MVVVVGWFVAGRRSVGFTVGRRLYDDGSGEYVAEAVRLYTARGEREQARELIDTYMHKLYETEKAYMVPAMVTKDNPDGFRLGKTILQKELQPEEITKLFNEAKTELLNGFISKRTKRAFAAHLTLDFETGKLGFEFAPRKKAAKKKTAS